MVCEKNLVESSEDISLCHYVTVYSTLLCFIGNAGCKMLVCCCFGNCLVLLQRGADPSIRNTDGKTALDLADPLSKSVLTGTAMFEIVLYI